MATIVFCRYLEQNPGDMQFFPKFSKVAHDKLVYDQHFNAQTLVVFEFLAKVVDNLGDVKAAGNLLRERVRTHKPREITMAQFEVSA